MKTALVVVLLALLSGWGGLHRLHDRNEAVQKARAAYARGAYATAAAFYQRAVVGSRPPDEAVLLNLGHASVRAGQLASARTAYGRLLGSRQPRLRSVARQQLGVLAAGKGDFAQALRLTKQALLADPANAGARHNYELISDYLRRRRDNPTIPPPAPAGSSSTPNRQPNRNSQPAGPGQDQSGQLDDPGAPGSSPNSAPAHPDPRGQRDPNRPSAAAGSTADGSVQAGPGATRPVARGNTPGTSRGLSDADAGPDTPAGSSSRAGTEAATLDEQQLQTQRARLQQMNLSTGRARQLLEALGAAEQQYLQQLPRRRTRKPDAGKPTW